MTKPSKNSYNLSYYLLDTNKQSKRSENPNGETLLKLKLLKSLTGISAKVISLPIIESRKVHQEIIRYFTKELEIELTKDQESILIEKYERNPESK